MRFRTVHIGFVVAVLAFALPCAAGGLGNSCNPAGTWWGQNVTFDLEFLVTITPIGAGRYSTVVEGISIVPPWEKSTAWRGELVKGDEQGTYEWWQLEYAGPSQLSAEDVPDIAAAHGWIVMVDCDHFEADFDFIGVYAWGQTPFVDTPMIPFPDAFATYTRMPTN